MIFVVVYIVVGRGLGAVMSFWSRCLFFSFAYRRSGCLLKIRRVQFAPARFLQGAKQGWERILYLACTYQVQTSMDPTDDGEITWCFFLLSLPATVLVLFTPSCSWWQQWHWLCWYCIKDGEESKSCDIELVSFCAVLCRSVLWIINRL